ncbi:MAG: hypothetical protein JRG90_13190 [Deltaproteobacteria bacterium]|nr:hypothetical protein [Deltaproteobacteria bacterium]
MEVSSFGIRGQTLYGAERFLPGIARIYRPDVVVIVVNMNDILPRPRGRSDQAASARFIRSILSIFRTHVDRRLTSVSHGYFLIRDRVKRLIFLFGYTPDELGQLACFEPDAPESAAAWRDVFTSLEQMTDTIQSHGASPMILVLPAAPQLGPEHADVWRSEYRLRFSDAFARGRPQQMIGRWSAERGVPLVDPLAEMIEHARESERRLFFGDSNGVSDWNHPTAAGHRSLGHALEAALRPHLPEPVSEHEIQGAGVHRRPASRRASRNHGRITDSAMTPRDILLLPTRRSV